jgi:hypothetical protein
MAARTLDGDVFHRDLADREIRELRDLALDQQCPALALQSLDAQEDRDRAGAGGAVQRHVDTPAGGYFHNPRQRVFLVDNDGVVGAQLLGDRQPGGILGRSGDDDQRRTGLLAGDRLRQPLLARPLDQHRGIVSHIAIEQRPFDTVGHRSDDPGQLGRHPVRHPVDHRVPGQVHILREAAPQMRRPLGRGIAIADGIRVEAPVGRLAMAVFAEMAPFAFHAGQVMLDEDPVAFLDALARHEAAWRRV